MMAIIQLVTVNTERGNIYFSFLLNIIVPSLLYKKKVTMASAIMFTSRNCRVYIIFFAFCIYFLLFDFIYPDVFKLKYLL